MPLIRVIHLYVYSFEDATVESSITGSTEFQTAAVRGSFQRGSFVDSVFSRSQSRQTGGYHIRATFVFGDNSSQFGPNGMTATYRKV